MWEGLDLDCIHATTYNKGYFFPHSFCTCSINHGTRFSSYLCGCCQQLLSAILYSACFAFVFGLQKMAYG